jgi:hypothetical protein
MAGSYIDVTSYKSNILPFQHSQALPDSLEEGGRAAGADVPELDGAVPATGHHDLAAEGQGRHSFRTRAGTAYLRTESVIWCA